jgi:hypothetical protein
LNAIEKSQLRYLHEITGMKSTFEEIQKEQQKIKDEMNLISQQLLHSIPPDTQQTSNEQSDDSIPLKESDKMKHLFNPNDRDHYQQQQSNEEVWLSLSSLTCSPSNEESLKINPSENSHQPDDLFKDSKQERERDSSISYGKRKFTVIFEDRNETEKLLARAIAEPEEGSDSDDYCSWKSRRE